jgi:hypothetical protein
MTYTKKIIITIIFILLILNYKTINNLILCLYVKSTNPTSNMINYNKKNSICGKVNEDLLIDYKFYLKYIPKIRRKKNKDINSYDREKLELFFDFIIKYREKIPTFEEIINNPEENFIYEEIFYINYLVFFLFVIGILIYCKITISPFWFFITENLIFINTLFYPNHKIFLYSSSMNLLYFINLLPIFLYVLFSIFILLNELNLYFSDILYVGSYSIIIMFFLLNVENIPNEYNIIYLKIYLSILKMRFYLKFNFF